MLSNNRQIADDLVSLFNKNYIPKISHSNDDSNLETRIQIYQPISFKGFGASNLTSKRVADFSVYSKITSGRDYTNEANISWLDRDFSAKYAPEVMDFLVNRKVNIIRISTIGHE